MAIHQKNYGWNYVGLDMDWFYAVKVSKFGDVP